MSTIKIIIILTFLLAFCDVCSAENDYYLNVSGPNGNVSNTVTIFAGEILTIKIVDVDGKTKGGTIFYNESGKTHDSNTIEVTFLDEAVEYVNLKDNSIEKSFDDTYTDRTITIFGQVHGAYHTINTVTVNVLTDFSTIEFNGTHPLTIRKDNPHKNDLEANFVLFINSSEKLEDELNNFNLSDNAKYFKSLDNVSASYEKIYELLEENAIIDQAGDGEIEAIKKEVDNIHNNFLGRMNDIVKHLKEDTVSSAQKEVDSKNMEYKEIKSKLKHLVLYPAGLLIIVGIIVGVVNVQHWKKREIYLKTYSKKAKAKDPVMISLVISAVLLLIMIAVLVVYGDLIIFKHLI